MPVCKKCGNRFPNRVKIDGIYKIINRRVYCLDCSPFGKHNTKRLDGSAREIKKGERRHLHQKEIRYYRKKALVDLLGGKCEICGYDKCLNSLNFHHVMESDKKMNLSRHNFTNTNRFALLEEVCKTILVCSNCHGEVNNGVHKDLVDKWKNNYENRKTLLRNKISTDQNNILSFRVVIPVIRNCKYCKKEFEIKCDEQKYCSHKCCEIDSRKVKDRPSKEEMGELINSMSWSAIGRKYGVCGVTIKNWAGQYGLTK
jgi:hypothetical protein